MNRDEEREYWARAVSEVIAASHLSTPKLAEHLGIESRTLAYWRNGKRRPTGLQAIRLYEYRRTLIGEQELVARTIVPCVPEKSSAP